MRFSVVALVALVSAHAVLAGKTHGRKQADSDFLEKQRRVLSFLVGYGTDVDSNNAAHEFPCSTPDYFTKEGVLENFMRVHKRGLLDKDGVFTLFCHKTRQDTFRIFELFYYAKDFDTFMRLGEWAKDELNSLQTLYAWMVAFYHRDDCHGVTVPPLYEVVPTLYVPSEVMHMAQQAKERGVQYRKFEVNNTGWEWSWHRNMLTGPFRSGPHWRGDQQESLMSYFREDPALSDWYVKFFLRIPSWVSTSKYPDMHFERRGEMYYIVHKWFLNRYNLERYANGLPPAPYFDVEKPLPGFNPRTTGLKGRNFLSRPEGMVPKEANSYGVWEFEQVERRLYDAIDADHVYDVANHKFVELNEKEGLDTLSKAVFGARDSVSRGYYRPYYYEALKAVHDMSLSSSDRELTLGPMSMFSTSVRDPAFYSILASMDELFETHMYKLHPYSKEDVDFPGVSIEKLEFDKLVTFFQTHEFEITNGVTFGARKDRIPYKYEASHFRLNHKPFTYKVTVKSDKEVSGTMRVFIGPKHDNEYRPLTYNQARHAYLILDQFPVKLTAGENVVERNSHDSRFFEHDHHYRAHYEKVNKSIENKEAFYYSEYADCGIPHNLMLPRGTKGGKSYSVFAVVTPYTYTHSKPDDLGPCGYHAFFDQHGVNFPFDRMIREDVFPTPNMKEATVTIYLKHEQDTNRPQTTD